MNDTRTFLEKMKPRMVAYKTQTLGIPEKEEL